MKEKKLQLSGEAKMKRRKKEFLDRYFELCRSYCMSVAEDVYGKPMLMTMDPEDHIRLFQKVENL